MWAKCFLQKTALDLVKYGLQRPNYDLPLHIGGRHSVLYFIIPATEKYGTAMYYIFGTPKMTKMTHFGGTKNATSGAWIEILRPLL